LRHLYNATETELRGSRTLLDDGRHRADPVTLSELCETGPFGDIDGLSADALRA